MHKQAAQVLARLATEPAGWTRERLHAVKLGLESQMDLDEIATALGRARSVIQEWFNFYREGGIERLLEVRRGKGPPSRLSAEALAALTKGLEEGRWRTTAQAQAFLAKEHGLETALSTVYTYLGKAGGRLRVPRPVHVKKDPQKAEAFKEELAAKLDALEIDPAQSVRLWVVDEMRIGLVSQPRRVWGLRGVRPTVPVQQRYEWLYVYGALEVGRARAELRYMPTVNLDCNQDFLAQIGAHDPGATHVVIYDGAGFHHRGGHAALPANVRVIALPAYSPELNPVERLWDQVRDALANELHANLEALE